MDKLKKEKLGKQNGSQCCYCKDKVISRVGKFKNGQNTEAKRGEIQNGQEKCQTK